MKHWAAIAFSILAIAGVALAHADGIFNPTASNVGYNDFGNIDSNKAGGGSSLACTYSPVTTGTQNVAYTGATPSASGGVPAYTFSETGALPTGLSINTSTGVISGTPSVNGSFPGIQVQVTDTASTVANCGASFTLVIAPACSAVLAVDGTPQTTTGTTSTTLTLTLTTTGTSDVWIVDFRAFSGIPQTAASVTSPHLTWNPVPGTTSLPIHDAGNTHFQWQFYATTTSALTSETVTITYAPSVNSTTAVLYAVSGAATTSSFDGNAGTTVTSTPASITTTNPNDFVTGGIQDASNTGTPGSGWTLVASANSFFSERQIVSSTGTFNQTITGDTIQTGIVSAIKRSCN